MTKDTSELVRKKRLQNEKIQEENRYTKSIFEKEIEECFDLCYQKKQLDEHWLSIFQKDEDFPFFVDLAEETRRAEQDIQSIAEEGSELLRQERRRLEEGAEELFEQELKLIKEEEKDDG